MCLTACKKVHQTPPQSKNGNMLQVELRLPEPWKHIIIGPSRAKEYPKVSNRFSIFMNGESTGTLKPYLNVSFEISQLSQQHPIEYRQKAGNENGNFNHRRNSHVSEKQ